MFKTDNNTINWKSTLQSVIVLTTIEVEYIVLTEAINESILLKWLNKKVVWDLYDSQGALDSSKHEVHYLRTKHIDMIMHFIWNEISKGTLKLKKVHTSNNLANVIIKPLQCATFCLNWNITEFYNQG